MATTLADLILQRDALARQIHDAQAVAKSAAIARVLALMDESGLTLADVAGGSGKVPVQSKRNAIKVPPKYRDPASGRTWSGRGLKPRWLVAAMASGRTLSDFLI